MASCFSGFLQIIGSCYEDDAPKFGGRNWLEDLENFKGVPLSIPPNGPIISRPKLVGLFDIMKTYLKHSSEPGTCIGSSHGWLMIMVHPNKPRIILHNPLTKSQILLPPLIGYTIAVIHKAILSGSPSETPKEEWTAMIIFGEDRKLAFVRKGEEYWTVIDAAGSFFEDVIYYSKKFFAVGECGRVVRIDLGHSNSQPRVTKITGPWFFRGEKIYLAGVPRGWGLWLIVKNIDIGPRVCWTDRFEVYKLNVHLSLWHWQRVGDLSDCMLFLGQNHSVSLSTSADTKFGKNCIFFTDGVNSEQDLGVFDFEDRTVIPLSRSSEWRKTTSIRPTWVIQEHS